MCGGGRQGGGVTPLRLMQALVSRKLLQLLPNEKLRNVQIVRYCSAAAETRLLREQHHVLNATCQPRYHHHASCDQESRSEQTYNVTTLSTDASVFYMSIQVQSAHSRYFYPALR